MRKIHLLALAQTSAAGLLIMACGSSEDGTAGANGATGTAGITAAVKVTDEDPGDNCEAGGFMIEYGADADASGSLGGAEIDGTVYLCHGEGTPGADGDPGADGMDGDPGADGMDGGPGGAGPQGDPGADGMDGDPGADGMDGNPGADGVDGSPGAPGINSLITISVVAPGAECEFGGQAIAVGLDDGSGSGTEMDGSLHADEIDQTLHMCDDSVTSSGAEVHVAAAAASVAAPGVRVFGMPDNNLVTNTSFASFTGWTVVNGGSGWTSPASAFFGGFAHGSYNYGEISQVVDLTTALSDAELDSAAVPLTIGSLCRKNGTPDRTVVRAEFRDGTSAVLRTDTLMDETIGWDNPQFCGGVVTDYPVGTREVRLVLGTDDGEFWAGQYATIFFAPVVVPGAMQQRSAVAGGAFSAWTPYNGYMDVTLPNSDGIYDVEMQFWDSLTKVLYSGTDAVELILP